MRFAFRRCANGAKTYRLLAEHFVERIASELGKDIAGISAGALKLLIEHDWPGNVRELENVIERAIVTFPTASWRKAISPGSTAVPARRRDWEVPDVPLGEMERRVIVAALERKRGNVRDAAAALESTARRFTTSSSATRSRT